MSIQKMSRLLMCAAVFLAVPFSASAQSTQYGNAGPWSLFRATDNGQVVECYATMPGNNGASMIFTHQASSTAFGLKTRRTNDEGIGEQVLIWFDNNRAEGNYVQMGYSGEWLAYTTSNSEPNGLLDLFANANTISFALSLPGGGVETSTFSLKGSNAMTKQTYDCFQNPTSMPSSVAAMSSPRGQGAGCPAAGSVRSGNSGQTATLHIANSSFRPLKIFWIDQNGQRQFYQDLAHGQDYQQPTYLTHKWIAVDQNGDCVDGVLEASQPGYNMMEIFGDG
ncbi:von Hippel-Lindau disease tumor suppressor protein [Maritimibacter alkaliphilus HTCC2654]|uniref:von Hippel-Lindau disease tumour suppressor beta domain-containing protein n=1 Tax=Maritimibacter alkaliphilus HTCC2654 TaxID=314271 RepID=A3VLR7_9RHOB|nr:hypothetical protein [Maritimibacter alkaliphilus]EAQ10844.1 hypothetical protein RB2654_21788 [Rhodobacterales bacterium HTCC2654] [Maritimibacter alkaliphilus HTCC2654]TYP80503.1 von Hippel-Lindau disease tumor suppressor protein [Maritimibacter alkaliphilus HTCC2654]